MTKTWGSKKNKRVSAGGKKTKRSKKTGGIGKIREVVLAIEELGKVKRMVEPAPAIGDPKGEEKNKRVSASSSFLIILV